MPIFQLTKIHTLTVNRTVAFVFLLLMLTTRSASAGWYAGPGLTGLNLSTSKSTVSLDALNTALTGAAGNTSTDVDVGSSEPSIAVGYAFGPNDEFIVETTLATSFDETLLVDGQTFATSKILPLNIFGAYQFKPIAVGTSEFFVRPIAGAGLTYVTHSGTEIVDPNFSQFGANLELSESVGFSALAGAAFQINEQVSAVLGLAYFTGINTDVTINDIQTVPFVSSPVIQLGGVELDGTAITARFQYFF